MEDTIVGDTMTYPQAKNPVGMLNSIASISRPALEPPRELRYAASVNQSMGLARLPFIKRFLVVCTYCMISDAVWGLPMLQCKDTTGNDIPNSQHCRDITRNLAGTSIQDYVAIVVDTLYR